MLQPFLRMTLKMTQSGIFMQGKHLQKLLINKLRCKNNIFGSKCCHAHKIVFYLNTLVKHMTAIFMQGKHLQKLLINMLRCKNNISGSKFCHAHKIFFYLNILVKHKYCERRQARVSGLQEKCVFQLIKTSLKNR